MNSLFFRDLTLNSLSFRKFTMNYLLCDSLSFRDLTWMHFLIQEYTIFSRNEFWIQNLFHEFTIKLLSISRINFDSQIFAIFCWSTMYFLSFSLINYGSIIVFTIWLYCRFGVKTDLTIFSQIHFVQLTLFLVNSLWIHYISQFCRFTRIYYVFIVFFANPLNR